MSALYSYLLSPAAVVFLANLAIASCLAAGLGLLAVRACRNRPAPLRHGLLLATTALLAISPILLVVAAWRGWPVVTLPLSAAKGGNAEITTGGETEASFAVSAASGRVAPLVSASGDDRPAAAQMLWRIAGMVAACAWAAGIAARSVRLHCPARWRCLRSGGARETAARPDAVERAAGPLGASCGRFVRRTRFRASSGRRSPGHRSCPAIHPRLFER